MDAKRLIDTLKEAIGSARLDFATLTQSAARLQMPLVEQRKQLRDLKFGATFSMVAQLEAQQPALARHFKELFSVASEIQLERGNELARAVLGDRPSELQSADDPSPVGVDLVAVLLLAFFCMVAAVGGMAIGSRVKAGNLPSAYDTVATTLGLMIATNLLQHQRAKNIETRICR